MRLMTRLNEDNLGSSHDPGSIYSSRGRVPAITAGGNSRYIMEERVNDKTAKLEVRVRRLLPQEAARVHGFVGMHGLKGTDAELWEMTGNSVCLDVSRALATGVKAYYFTEWMKGHVRSCHRED